MLIPNIPTWNPAGNRLGVLRKKRDKEILRITAKYPEMKEVCEEIATRSVDIEDNDEVLKPLDLLCAEIHAEELSAVRRL